MPDKRNIRRCIDDNLVSSKEKLEVEGKIITTEKDITESLTYHFVTVGPKLASKLESKPDDDSLKHINYQQNTLIFVPIDDAYVLNAIKQLKIVKAPGPDKTS